jgi:hypothetical protein
MSAEYKLDGRVIKFRVWVGNPKGLTNPNMSSGSQVFQNLQITNYYGSRCTVSIFSKTYYSQIVFRDVDTGTTDTVWDRETKNKIQVPPAFSPIKPIPPSYAELQKDSPYRKEELIESVITKRKEKTNSKYHPQN